MEVMEVGLWFWEDLFRVFFAVGELGEVEDGHGGFSAVAVNLVCYV
jgi:hypothetical protein